MESPAHLQVSLSLLHRLGAYYEPSDQALWNKPKV